MRGCPALGTRRRVATIPRAAHASASVARPTSHAHRARNKPVAFAAATALSSIAVRLTVSSLEDGSGVLRQRLAEEGYVYVRGAIASEVLERLQRAATRAGIAAGLIGPRGELAARDLRAVTRDAVDTLCHSADFRHARYAPSLRALGRAVGAGRPHPAPHAAYARFIPPRDQPSRMAAHQDRHFLQKPFEFVTVWLPVLMPRGGGGIRLVAGSHRKGPITHEAGRIVRAADTWSAAEYRAGDAVVFTGYTVHESLPNHARSLRVSVDYRYVLERPLHA